MPPPTTSGDACARPSPVHHSSRPSAAGAGQARRPSGRPVGPTRRRSAARTGWSRQPIRSPSMLAIASCGARRFRGRRGHCRATRPRAWSSRSRPVWAVARSCWWHDGKAKQLIAYDGRETAPAAARPDRFMRDGEPMAFLRRGASAARPSASLHGRLLEMAHRQHGTHDVGENCSRRPSRWPSRAFAVSRRLHALLSPDGIFRSRVRGPISSVRDGKPRRLGHYCGIPPTRRHCARSRQVAPTRSIG